MTKLQASIEIVLFLQKESARQYAAARWEIENGSISRTIMLQECAAQTATLARNAQ